MSSFIVEQKENVTGKLYIPEVINGAGIRSIEQTTKSTESDGVNVITVEITDGSTTTFEVRNGSKGEKGDSASDYNTISNTPIKNLYSDESNMIAICELESGVYRFIGAFTPYPDSQIYYNFTKGQLVNIITASAGTHVQSFYPDDNRVQFCAIIRDESAAKGWTVEEKDVRLNDLADLLEQTNITDEQYTELDELIV